MANEKDVAVVGMACVFPQAANLKQYWSNLANGVDAIDLPPPGRWAEHNNFGVPPGHQAHIPCSRGGFLPPEVLFDPVAHRVLPNLARYGDPDQFLMLHVIDQALRDARVAEDSPVRQRTDIIIGRGGYPTGKLIELTLKAELYEIVLEQLDRGFPDVIGSRRTEMERYLRGTLTPQEVDAVSTAIPNITASRTANRLNLHGAAFTVDGACASSLLAVEQAVWRLRNAQCDLAVAAGLFLSLSPTFLYVFTQLGALSPSGNIRPFDRRADGLLPGEGGGALVLKRLGDSLRDGDEVYAILKGVGSSSDGKHVDVLAPAPEGQVRALERAYADAGVDPETVGYLELHGTGTIVGDLAEITTIKKVFGTAREPATARAMGSVKSMIGHTMPAAGIASLIKTALALSNKVLAPSLHCEEPRPELADAPFYLNTKTRPWVHNPTRGPRRAGINAFGLGGINAHVVLEEVAPASPKRGALGARRGVELNARPGRNSDSGHCRQRPLEMAVHRPSELAVFTAASAEDLSVKLARLEHFLDKDRTGAAVADVASSLWKEADLGCSYRLALVCADLDHLRKQVAAWRARPRTAEAEGIYCAAKAAGPRGKVAFVFPGMGFPGMVGNYPDHLLETCLHFPEVREEFDHFEDRDRHPEDKVPTSAIFSPPAGLPEEYRQRLKARLAPPKADDYDGLEALAHERYLAAMGVTLGNWAGWVLLRKFKIAVDMITGQSQGEMAGLCAAGAADFHDMAPCFWAILNVDSRDPSGGRLAFAFAPAEKVAPLLAETPGVYVSIYMLPEAVVLGGDRDGLVRIAERLREEQVLVQLLPYAPIHTPCLSHLRAQLQERLQAEHVAITRPRIDFYSSITAEKYPEDEQGIREVLMMNVDRPLRIWQTVRRMYEDGARTFVQVGGGHMAAHLESLLPQGAEVVTAALDVDTRSPLTQLNHLCGQLFAAGVPLDLAPLFERRAVRPLDFDAPQAAPAPPATAVPLRIDWSPLRHASVPPRHPSAPAAAPISPALPAMPVLGTLTRFVPESQLVLERRLDLAEDLFLRDHLFVFAPCKPAEECLPILPLAMSLEFLAEVGALLAPGRGLIGFENIRAHRWIGLRSATVADLRIEAHVEAVDSRTGVVRVRAEFFAEDGLSFTGTALLADEYRQDIDLQIADTSAGCPWPFALEEVYGQRLMFHGPAFHTVADLHTFGNPAASATLMGKPRDRLFASNPDPLLLTDPCLMDGIGQILGLWARAFHHYILPIGIERIEFYAPPPPAGTLVPLRLEVLQFDPDVRQVRSNFELEDGQGQVWARIAGWSDWLLNWTDAWDAVSRLPTQALLGVELDLVGLPEGSVCMLVKREDVAGVDLDWMARLFLHVEEMADYVAIEDKQRRREMVLGRAAAKDAVRLWGMRTRETELQHPAEFCLGHDTLGRPFLAPDGERPRPHVSVGHTRESAVAIAAGLPVGVDLEPVTRDARAILDQFATAEERTLLDEPAANAAEEAWEVRLWCAKEALGKALGTGLQGRPRDFEAIAIDEGGAFLMYHHPTGERFVVHTARTGGVIVAYTAAETARGARAAASPWAGDHVTS